MLNKLITKLSSNSFDPVLNTLIANEYEKIGQTAAAISFYLRTAEYGYDTHPEHVYASLIRSSICFDGQQNRTHTVRNLLEKAIAYNPQRPEAYFLLARYYERTQKWQECYTMSEIGLVFSGGRLNKLPLDVEYLGKYCLEFEKAVAGWYVGRREESIETFKSLLTQDISEQYRKAVEHNLSIPV